jgi:hypothetical protein
MSVIVENFVIHKGEDFSKDFTIQNTDKSLTDISSYQVSAYIAKYPDSENVMEFSVGITTANSKIKISIASTVTVNLDSSRNYYNVFVISDSIKKKIREGEALVRDSIF